MGALDYLKTASLFIFGFIFGFLLGPSLLTDYGKFKFYLENRIGWYIDTYIYV